MHLSFVTECKPGAQFPAVDFFACLTHTVRNWRSLRIQYLPQHGYRPCDYYKQSSSVITIRVHIKSGQTRALKVNILIALLLYTLHTQFSLYCTYRVYCMCIVHYWLHLHCTLHLHIVLVCTSSVHQKCIGLHWVHLHCTVSLWVTFLFTLHVHSFHVSTFTVQTARTRCWA